MSPLAMFIPLTKVDAEKRLVYGIATAEVKDRSGEICDYALSKPNFQKWSDDVHAASGGLSKGNLRVMHGKVAAGRLTEIHFNDAAKQIEICAEVVDDNEWAKVEKGVYTGFSQGGSYGQRFTDATGTKRYEAKPNEISLVDLPCLKTATFEMVKGEGIAPEVRHFADAVTVAPPTQEQVNAKADELAKAAGVPDFSQFLEPARDALIKAALPPPPAATTFDAADLAPAPGMVEMAGRAPKHDGHQEPPAPPPAEGEQVWKSSRDGSTHATKADMRRHHAMLDAQRDAAPALDAVRGMGKAAEGPRPRLMRETGPDALAKDLAAASRLADLVQQLAWLQTRVQAETVREGDGSPMAGKIKDAITTLADLLPPMVTEEVGELFSPAMTGGVPTPDYYYNAAGMLPPGHVDALVKLCGGVPTLADSAALAKVGARHSAKDMDRIQAMHDHACDLGATCAAEKGAAPADLAKAAGDLQKAETARDDALGKLTAAEGERDAALAKNAGLEKDRDDALAKAEAADLRYDALKEVTATIPDEIAKVRKMVEDQPVPRHLQGRAVSKAEDTGGTDPAPAVTADQVAAYLKDMSESDRALIMVKAARGYTMPIG